ncbi:glutathione S-transferase-like [Euwallacea fornicatus]|uniref:glutathione S-transferase-like n=1 Tax=Euwallacea fornicatus TaxID=995702 RepID=UPI00338E4188
MAPRYKLTYFDLTGLGESIRLLFHYGGINFEDNRVPKDQWPALKPATPLGQLPLLEVDGKVLYQSTAIARYVANLVGLDGKTALENWEIDAVVDTVNDLRAKFFVWFFESDEAKKAQLAQTLDTETLPFLLGKLEGWANKNGGYLALGKLTWADIYFISNTDFICLTYKRNFIEGYPNLEKLRKNVTSLPAIKAWIAKRPKDDM